MKTGDLKMKLADPLLDDYDVFLTDGSYGEATEVIVDHNKREVLIE